MSVTELRPPGVVIGASDIAAASGVHPYVSPVMLWLQLTGRVERPETEAMRLGTLLEPVIIEQVMERGYAVDRPVQDEYRDSERPWLIGHPDSFTIPVEQMMFAERWVLEVKTCSQFAWPADDVPPFHYQAQAQTYMHLTGVDRALLAVLVGGQRLELAEVERDDKAIVLLLDAADTFQGYVVRDEPPPVDGSDSARDALALLYPTAQDAKAYRLTAAEWKACQELRARKEQAAAIDKQVTELENVLKAAMGDAEVALSPHDTEALRWRNVKRTALDVAEFKRQRPELSSLFVTETTSRRFTVL